MRSVEALKFSRLLIRLYDAFTRLRVLFGEPALSAFARGSGRRRIGCTASRKRQLCAGSSSKADVPLPSQKRTFRLRPVADLGYSGPH